MKNVAVMFLILVIVLLASYFIHRYPIPFNSEDVLEKRNISCSSVLKHDYLGFDISGWLRDSFNDGYVEASEMIPKDVTYILPVVMNVARNCRSDSNFTYCPVGVAREFVDVDENRTVVGKEKVWIKLMVKSDRIDTNYSAGQHGDIYSVRSKYHVAECIIEEVHVEKE